MNTNILSPVETKFLSKQDITPENSKIPYLLVDSFPHLGMITALRFLENQQTLFTGTLYPVTLLLSLCLQL